MVRVIDRSRMRELEREVGRDRYSKEQREGEREAERE